MKSEDIKTISDCEKYLFDKITLFEQGTISKIEVMAALQGYTKKLIKTCSNSKSKLRQQIRITDAIYNQKAPTNYFDRIQK